MKISKATLAMLSGLGDDQAFKTLGILHDHPTMQAHVVKNLFGQEGLSYAVSFHQEPYQLLYQSVPIATIV